MKELSEYCALPWTVHGRGCAEGGESYYLITIEEMPGFSVVGKTRLEAEHEFKAVLAAYLEAALASGAEIPMPAIAGAA